MFHPKPQYDIYPDTIHVKDFFEYREEFVVRPPYQRKNVWDKRKQQSLLDSLIRGYYIPKLVLREIRMNNEQVLWEVIDGQQRILTAFALFSGEIALPDSLGSLSSDLAGKFYSELSPQFRKFVDKELKYSVDRVKSIHDPRNPSHQELAAEIFWRLQQGVTLTYMEKAHSRLSSLSRNFVVKYADDISFDYESYSPIEDNPTKHKFFRLISRKNDRMQHLALLTRLLILEENDGPADIKDSDVESYIDQNKSPEGIGNFSFEQSPTAKLTLKILDRFVEIFKNDPMIQDSEDDEIKELGTEYFIISFYLLLRHLVKSYVFQAEEQTFFRIFLLDFFQKWKSKKEDNADILRFASSRQQSANEVELRHIILRQLFFEFLAVKQIELKTLDANRTFSEFERIRVYRAQEGMCQMCKGEGKSDKESTVSWRKFEADHIDPWVHGGKTEPWNAQVLCKYHNKVKSSSVDVNP